MYVQHVLQYDVRARVDVLAPGGGPDVPGGPVGGPRVAVQGALTYIASPDRGRNANYLGPAEPEAIAAQIASSAGPSGHNSV